MSIPSKVKARARLPKRVPGKGQKFTLTLVQYSVCLELRGEIAIESAMSVFILWYFSRQIVLRTYSGFVDTRKISAPGFKAQHR